VARLEHVISFNPSVGPGALLQVVYPAFAFSVRAPLGFARLTIGGGRNNAATVINFIFIITYPGSLTNKRDRPKGAQAFFFFIDNFNFMFLLFIDKDRSKKKQKKKIKPISDDMMTLGKRMIKHTHKLQANPKIFENELSHHRESPSSRKKKRSTSFFQERKKTFTCVFLTLTTKVALTRVKSSPILLWYPRW
jgi:hypothetical protein